MVKATKTLRRSIHAFLHGYRSFAFIAAFFVFPFSAAILLAQTLTPSSPVIETLHSQISVLFRAAGFPASSQFFYLLNLKLSQTIFSFMATLPLAITFLLLAKASVIIILEELPLRKFTLSLLFSILRLYRNLLPTHIFNSFIILSANASVFSLLFVAFNVIDSFHFSSTNVMLVASAASAILYSVILANTMAICNLAIIVAAVEKIGGYLPILRACLLIRGKEATAITLALPANLGMAAMEALFHYRVVNPWRNSGRSYTSGIWEAFSIAYLHSLVIVLDIIIGFMLYRSCRSSRMSNWDVMDYYLDSRLHNKSSLQT